MHILGPPGQSAHELHARYYGQRASVGGLLITEASQVSRQGQGYPSTPGCYTDEHVRGWRLTTEAVHAKGGYIYLQLWHVGRISHPSYQEGGLAPVSASAVTPAGQALTPQGSAPYVCPRPLALDEMPALVESYRAAAVRAKAAGFDGVELHAANGYLLDQVCACAPKYVHACLSMCKHA